MKNIFLVIALTCLFLLSCSEQNQNTNTIVSAFSDSEIDKQVDLIMSKMSLAEKLAQIEGIRPQEVMENDTLSLQKCREIIPHGIGHVCQFSSGLTMSPNELRDFVRAFQNYLITETAGGIPAIFHEEAITGFATQGATTFPQQIGMGCSWNPELIAKNTASTAKLMRSAGATFALSPMLDISRTAHWSRIEESYGEDAYLTSALGLAFVNGLQGNSLKTGVAATTKHFAGYGTQNNNSKELYEEYLMPHEVVIKKGNVKSVMPSYGKYKNKAVVINEEMLTTMLRNEIGFNGIVVSDYGAINLVHSGHKQASSKLDAAVLALKAGTDIELPKPQCFPFIPEAIEQGLISIEKINEVVKRSLIMKARLGLLDKDVKIGIDGDLDFDPPENRELAYESACQSIVLLKNNGILPLQKQIKNIALIGPNAATVHGLLGDYTYQSMISFWWTKPFDPNNPKLVSLKEGLQNKLGNNINIQHERGCDWSAPLESKVIAGIGDDRLSKVKMMTIEGLPQPDMQRAIKIANESDVIIAAMGENIYLCGEGREREGIKLPGDQEAFVEKLLQTNKPLILVIFGGRPQVVNKLENKCAAIIQAWFPGEEGGNALADIIAGSVNPSAKLCVSYPLSEEKTELNYKNTLAYNNIQYPFGYGLSYTTYAYSDINVPETASIHADWIPIDFKIKNTGVMEGTEITQLYIKKTGSSVKTEIMQLKGFQRVNLRAGEEKQVKFKFSPEQLAQYNEGKWFIEPGIYEFMAAASCTDIRLKASIEISGKRTELINGRSVYFSKNE